MEFLHVGRRGAGPLRRADRVTGGGTWRGVYVDRRPIVGEFVWSVTISSPGHDTRQRLFAERESAYAFAFDHAEELELPLFDNSDPGDLT
jgi:hypothetical protein